MKKDGKYMEHLTDNQEMGQAQVLEAGEEDKPKEYPDKNKKVGNQSKEYYEDY